MAAQFKRNKVAGTENIYAYVKWALEVVLSMSPMYPNSLSTLLSYSQFEAVLQKCLEVLVRRFWEGLALGAKEFYAPNVHV